MKKFLWMVLWISMSLNVVYFVETDVWIKEPASTFFALVWRVIERSIVG